MDTLSKPVAYIADCGTIVSESDPFFDDYKNPQPLYTAPPTPAYPERLPCPVHLLPGLKFGKGVPTHSLLDALVRRAEYEAELEAMTPEQRAENDARLEKLKALIPQAPPALPESFQRLLHNAYGMTMGNDWNNGTAAKHHREKLCEAVNACRAEMLAQPVSHGYKLPNAWIPRDERMPKDGDVVLVFQEGGIIFCAEVDDGEFYPDEFPRVPTQGREITHWMPLPAAPEVSRDDA
ncbi:DUF551 domain-containing protein [Serratia ureilytica]